jgi:hypothetical protein
VRLQHSGGEALYREWLQATTPVDSCSVFVRAQISLRRYPKPDAKSLNAIVRLAHTATATRTASAAAVGFNSGGGYQSAEKQDCGSKNE